MSDLWEDDPFIDALMVVDEYPRPVLSIEGFVSCWDAVAAAVSAVRVILQNLPEWHEDSFSA